MSPEDRLNLAIMRFKLVQARYDLARSSHRVDRALDDVSDAMAQTPLAANTRTPDDDRSIIEKLADRR